MTSLYEFVRITIERNLNLDPVYELDSDRISLIHKHINDKIYKAVSTYQEDFLKGQLPLKKVDMVFEKSKTILEAYKNNKPINSNKIFFKKSNVKMLFGLDSERKRDFNLSVKHTLALYLHYFGFYDYCKDEPNLKALHAEGRLLSSINNYDEKSFRSFPELMKQFENIAFQITRNKELLEKDQLNLYLLRLSSKGVYDFDSIVLHVIEEELMDSISYFQISSIPYHHLTQVQRYSIIRLTVWILSNNFDFRTYNLLKSQFQIDLEFGNFELFMSVLAALMLIHRSNSSIASVLKQDFNKVSSTKNWTDIPFKREHIQENILSDKNLRAIKMSKVLYEQAIVLFLEVFQGISYVPDHKCIYAEKINQQIQSLIDNRKVAIGAYRKELRIMLSYKRVFWGQGEIDFIIGHEPKSQELTSNDMSSNKVFTIDGNRESICIGITNEIREQLLTIEN